MYMLAFLAVHTSPQHSSQLQMQLWSASVQDSSRAMVCSYSIEIEVTVVAKPCMHLAQKSLEPAREVLALQGFLLYICCEVKQPS